MQRRKRLYVALAIYAVLGLLIWITMVDVPLPLGSGHIGIRSLTLMVLAFFALRTLLHGRADQVRSEQEEKEVSTD